MHAEHADGDSLNDLSGRVIGYALTVLDTVGAGFLETVYETALACELREAGLSVVQQAGTRVHDKGVLVGAYFVDLFALLVELKTVRALDDTHRMQGTNYLNATGPRCIRSTCQ